MSEERAPVPQTRTSRGGVDETHAPEDDAVTIESAQSFPASDPPSWSGTSRFPAADRERPPQGPKAGWSVERAEGDSHEAEAALSGDAGTRLDRDPADNLELPVPADDALQG